MAWIGVSCFFPPKGISTVPAPMVESKRSLRPRLEQQLRSDAVSRRSAPKLPETGFVQG